jgi:glyoxylase-like metal-dependent hydrolase (beta-lactamase superfamily II)
MTTTFVAALRRCLVLLVAISFSGFAANSAPPASPMSAQLVKTGLYLIQGGGANTLMRFSATGLIIVDGKSPGMYRDLMSQIRKINKISDLPVRVLILTDADESRSGNVARFAAAGVPLVVHESTKRAIEARATDPSPKYVTFDEQYSIHMGGVEVQVMHLRNRGTDGNSIVYFPGLKVVAVGGLYTAGTPTDSAARSSALDELLKLDFDTAVPSEGAPVTRADVVALKARLEAAR